LVQRVVGGGAVNLVCAHRGAMATFVEVQF